MNKFEMLGSVDSRSVRWSKHLSCLGARVREPGVIVEGKLSRAAGLTLEAVGCEAAVGARCMIEGSDGIRVEAEVVGFANNRLYLMPTNNLSGIMPNARVIPMHTVSQVPAGEALLGRVIDGAGNPLDGRGPLHCEDHVRLNAEVINPLTRQPISEPLDVGVRAINSMLTVGRGQRIGLFAGSGVGKSSLLAMMTRFTKADVIVVGLIGERGREVKEFVEDNLGAEGLSRSVVVTTPADCTPLMRIHGAWVATSIAEYFRDQGKSVLLLMDSLTRFAQAQREIGLAIGEPPATKGYPPSVFAKLPQLVERAGTGISGNGSITAFYTVLAEGDHENDPIVDAARAILDGHVMLSRDMAESGIYPPIDIESSVSRSMIRVTSSRHRQAAQKLRDIYSYYVSHRDLMTVGAYQAGADRKLDQAVGLWPEIQAFLTQSMEDSVSLEQSINQLEDLLSRDALQTDVNHEDAGQELLENQQQ